jgi:hypothetical protein
MPKEVKLWEDCNYAVGLKLFRKGKRETQIPEEIKTYACRSKDIITLEVYPFGWIVDKNESLLMHNPAKFHAYKASFLYEPKGSKNIDLGLAMCRHCEFFKSKPKSKKRVPVHYSPDLNQPGHKTRLV